MQKEKENVFPTASGYWEYDQGTETLMLITQKGTVIEAKELEGTFSYKRPLYSEADVESEESLEEAGMTFGEALELLKAGFKVARKGWNGKGMYLWLKPGATIKKEHCRDPLLIECIEKNGDKGEIEALPTICMFTHDSSGRNAILTGWLASQSDMLLEDWVIVE